MPRTSVRAATLAPLALTALLLAASPPGIYRLPSPADRARLGPALDAGVTKMEAFFGAPFARRFRVRVAPSRRALDRAFARRWGAPPTECWMVAAGVADELFLLDPAVWKAEACEHDGADAGEVGEIVAHELVHVYHGQHSPHPEFEGMDETAWFSEGLAVLASGQLESRHRGGASAAAAAGALPSRLAEVWSGRSRYGAAGSLVAFVDQTHGRAVTVRLLGATTNAEILSALGTTEEALLSSWKRALHAERLRGLSWMAGHWGTTDDAGTSEEGWFGPGGTVLLGVHRDVAPGGATFFESLRIEARPDGLFYVASPMGRGETAFRLTSLCERRAVFENPDHDFPRRITYRREGDVLYATAEGSEGGRPREEGWAWSLMP